MRVFGWALAWALIGLIAGYAATVGAGIVIFEVFRVSQREGAAAMGLVFVIGPLGACITALAAAIAAAMITSKRERERAGGTLSPRRPWGRNARGILGGALGFVAGYGAAVLLLYAFYTLRGTPYFDSYGWALAAAWLPILMAVAGAVFGVRVALRDQPPKAAA